MSSTDAGGGEEGKSTLAQKDVRFARTIQRLQRAVLSELEKVATIQLYTLGYRGDDLLSFKLKLNNPSKIAELQELEHWNTKFTVSAQAVEGFFSKRWVARNLFDMSEEEFLRNQREMFYDMYFAQSLEAAGQQALMAAAGGGGGGMGMPGDEMGGMGGEEMAPGAEMPPEGAEEAEEIGPPPEAEGGGEEGETALLATPGKRDDVRWVKMRKKDGAHQTQGSKGKWYKPVTADGRGHSGPRKRNYLAQASHEMGKLPPRQVRMLPAGAAEMLGLGKGISEDKETNYNKEEQKLFEVNQNIVNLIKDLEQRDNAETQ